MNLRLAETVIVARLKRLQASMIPVYVDNSRIIAASLDEERAVCSSGFFGDREIAERNSARCDFALGIVNSSIRLCKNYSFHFLSRKARSYRST